MALRFSHRDSNLGVVVKHLVVRWSDVKSYHSIVFGSRRMGNLALDGSGKPEIDTCKWATCFWLSRRTKSLGHDWHSSHQHSQSLSLSTCVVSHALLDYFGDDES